MADQDTSNSAAMSPFRHYGFADGYPETDLGHTAQTWALILDRLATYASTGKPQPFFPEPS